MGLNRRNFLMKCGALGLTASAIPALFYLGNDDKKKNIIFIIVDDMRPQLGAYRESLQLHGNNLIQTPNIDLLAKDGTVFERAYCSVPVCGASRLSLLTGSRPYKLPNQPYGRHWAYYSRLNLEATASHYDFTEPAGLNNPGNSVTMPQHFKNNGYKTLSIGKVYHNVDDDKEAWDDLVKLPGENWRDIPAFEIGTEEKDDDYYVDGRTTKYVMDKVVDLKEDNFFYAVGYARPHLPFNCPKKYWDMYPEEEIELPPNFTNPVNAPDESIHNFGELRNYTGVEFSDESQNYVTDEYAKQLIRGYYACTSYVDAQIGRLVDKLKKTYNNKGVSLYDQTTIALIGDHGWNLAEHNLWCKHSNYNTSIQSPLIIRDPDIKGGKKANALVEFVDLYPTFSDLAGLERPKPTIDNDGSEFNLHGTSLVPLMQTPDQEWKKAVFSRYHYGDTIRTDRYTYSEFVNQSDSVLNVMLFDHVKDPHENYNIADINPELVNALSELLGNGAIAKRNAWRKFVDTSEKNKPVLKDLNLPKATYPAKNYPGNGQVR